MFTPITWANPNRLKHIQDIRQSEQLNIDQVENKQKRQVTLKKRIFESLNKYFDFGWLPKLSNSTYFW